MSELLPRVIAVIGPTATGKSDLAVALARQLGGEVVNADSMQLYAGMDIGTAKLPSAERGGVVHHLLDVWPLAKSAAVADYQTMARAKIAELHRRNVVPIMVGGSGLYVRGVLDRLDFPGESPAVRAGLYAALADSGPEALHARLAVLDPLAAAAILPSNGRRIARALEVIELTGKPFTARMPGFDSIYDAVQVGIDRDDLDDRVEQRVHRMIEQGFLDEIHGLLGAGLRASPTASKALGYAQLLSCMDDDGAIIGDFDEAIDQTIRGTRKFVKRQRAWFRRDPRVHWFDGARPDLVDAALRAAATT